MKQNGAVIRSECETRTRLHTSDVGTFRRFSYAVLHDRIDVRFEFEMTLPADEFFGTLDDARQCCADYGPGEPNQPVELLALGNWSEKADR